MALIRELRSLKEIRQAVDGYCNYDKTLNSDPEYALKVFSHKVRMKKFIRGYFEGSIMVGCIYADIAQLPHLPFPYFQQFYFYTEEKGKKAFNIIKHLHDSMILEAKRQELAFCISMGSHNDEKFTFARILEKHGWERINYLAYYQLDPKRPYVKALPDS